MITSINNWRMIRESEEKQESPEVKDITVEDNDEKEEKEETEEKETESEEKEEKEESDESEEKKDTKNIAQVGRLSEAITGILNTQIKNELMSSQLYLGMTCFLDDKGWIGASKYYFKTAKEELNHMNKIYDYLFDRNVKAVVPTTDDVKQEYSGIREILEASLQHEIEVTKNWNDISDKAKAENDNTTYEFAQWFLAEQVEEENKFREILFKLDLDMPDWKIDELFEALNA